MKLRICLMWWGSMEKSLKKWSPKKRKRSRRNPEKWMTKRKRNLSDHEHHYLGISYYNQNDHYLGISKESFGFTFLKGSDSLIVSYLDLGLVDLLSFSRGTISEYSYNLHISRMFGAIINKNMPDINPKE